MEELMIKVISQDVLLSKFRSIVKEELACQNIAVKYYTINQVAKMLCVGHTRINTLVKKGKIITNAFGRIPSTEIEKLNDSNFKARRINP